MNIFRKNFKTIRISNNSVQSKINENFPIEKNFSFGSVKIQKLTVNLDNKINLNFDGVLNINDIEKEFSINSTGILIFNNDNFYFEPDSISLSFKELEENSLINTFTSSITTHLFPKFSLSNIIETAKEQIIELIKNKVKTISVFTLDEKSIINLAIENVSIENNFIVVEFSFKKMLGILLMVSTIILSITLLIFIVYKIINFPVETAPKNSQISSISKEEDEKAERDAKMAIFGFKSLAYIMEKIVL